MPGRGPLLVFLVLVLAAVVIGVLASRASRRRAEQQVADELAVVRRVAEEDVTRLGEEVAGLDTVTAGRELDEGTRQDYRRALDSYDRAKHALDLARRPDDLRAVTEALEDGRYAIACVHARIEGQPLPQRRPPCFFNPQHGPSVQDVEWAPPGGAPRMVPVCLPDAERVRAGAEPDARKVLVPGGGYRPYWEAGPMYAPWAMGYFSPFAGSGLLPGVLMGALVAGSFGGWDDGYDMFDSYDGGADDYDAVGADGDVNGGDYADGGDYPDPGAGDFGDFGGGDMQL